MTVSSNTPTSTPTTSHQPSTAATPRLTHHANDVGRVLGVPVAVHEDLLQQQDDADGQGIRFLGRPPLQASNDDCLGPGCTCGSQVFCICGVALHVGESASGHQELGLLVREPLQALHSCTGPESSTMGLRCAEDLNLVTASSKCQQWLDRPHASMKAV